MTGLATVIAALITTTSSSGGTFTLFVERLAIAPIRLLFLRSWLITIISKITDSLFIIELALPLFAVASLLSVFAVRDLLLLDLPLQCLAQLLSIQITEFQISILHLDNLAFFQQFFLIAGGGELYVSESATKTICKTFKLALLDIAKL
jgi:hypothetical protein